jgi:hypothetical protein
MESLLILITIIFKILLADLPCCMFVISVTKFCDEKTLIILLKAKELNPEHKPIEH